ncbi:hypothetical protein [Candidatus Orientia mediorientalis]|nr:hypothetical protein [Candidatus Orientia mediorientalis]
MLITRNAYSNFDLLDKYGTQGKKFSVSISTNGIENSLSTINILDLISSKYGWNDSIIGRIIIGCPSFYIALINHEVVGHGRRAYEFGGTVTRYSFSLFSAVTYMKNLPNIHLQQNDVTTISGVQINTCLAAKIVNQLLTTNQPLNPITAWSYIFSAGNQFWYISHDVTFNMLHRAGTGDLNQHIQNMENIYGDNSIRSKIQFLSFLDLIDPMLFASLYTIISGQNIKVPMIPLGQINGLGKIGFMPSANLILTPYNVLEKRITIHINTEYTPVKVAFGFGRELKSNNPVSNLSGSHFFTKKDSTSPKIHDTYYFEFSVPRLFSIKKADLGFSLALWRQPELMTPVPRYAEIKNGIMGLLNLTFKINNMLSLFAEAGYKTKGFILDQPIEECAIMNFALRLTV